LFPIQGAELDDKNLALIQRLYTVIYIFTVLKWLLIAAGVLLMCVSIYLFAFKRNDNKIMEMEDKNRVVFAYDSRAYIHEPGDISDALSMSNVSDIIRNEKIGVQRRKIDRFPGKLNSNFEPNKIHEDVGLGVSRDANSKVTLSNVFM
jgi:type IV secretory pathway TrbD component